MKINDNCQIVKWPIFSLTFWRMMATILRERAVKTSLNSTLNIWTSFRMQKLSMKENKIPLHSRPEKKKTEGKIVTYLQKLIKLEDYSELVWKTVNLYEVYPLVDDSDDEERLIRAEARANRKAKHQKPKKSRRRYAPYGRWSSSTTKTQPMREHT